MKQILFVLCLTGFFSCGTSTDKSSEQASAATEQKTNASQRAEATTYNTSLDSLSVKAIKETYGDSVQAELCNSCQNQGSLKITISRVNDVFQVNLADYSTASAILAIAKEKGLTKTLKNNGDTVSFLTRCICFQVTDPNGTRTECFLCEEPPVVHCIGPFPYCPSNKSIFNVNDDDSKNYIEIQNVHLPNEVCVQGWMVMNNSHPSRKIRVYYNFNNRPMVCDVAPKTYVLLGCKGGNYVKTSSQYI